MAQRLCPKGARLLFSYLTKPSAMWLSFHHKVPLLAFLISFVLHFTYIYVQARNEKLERVMATAQDKSAQKLSEVKEGESRLCPQDKR